MKRSRKSGWLLLPRRIIIIRLLMYQHLFLNCILLRYHIIYWFSISQMSYQISKMVLLPGFWKRWEINFKKYIIMDISRICVTRISLDLSFLFVCLFLFFAFIFLFLRPLCRVVLFCEDIHIYSFLSFFVSLFVNWLWTLILGALKYSNYFLYTPVGNFFFIEVECLPV